MKKLRPTRYGVHYKYLGITYRTTKEAAQALNTTEDQVYLHLDGKGAELVPLDFKFWDEKKTQP